MFEMNNHSSQNKTVETKSAKNNINESGAGKIFFLNSFDVIERQGPPNTFADLVGLQVIKKQGANSSGLVQSLNVQTQNGIRRVEREIPTENFDFSRTTTKPSEFVVNAGLQTGANLLNSVLTNLLQKSKISDTANAVYVFIDINNLGWINKNFSGHKKTGDVYIQHLAKILTKTAGKDGLVFRLGGDEFALIIPATEPNTLRQNLEQLIDNVKRETHYIFKSETKSRADFVSLSLSKYRSGLIEKKELDEIINDFKKYASFSQEGVSVGAEYITSSLTESQIRQRAEQRAFDMKLEMKKAHHQDISKYTGNNLKHEGLPRLKFKYKIPLVQPGQKVSELAFVPEFQNDAKKIQLTELVVLKKLGPDRVSILQDEAGQQNVFSVSENSNRATPLEVNANTGMLDLKDNNNKKILTQLIQSKNDHQIVWVNLLNLGKLNYFKSGMLTGDKALSILAKKIKSQLKNEDLAFKSFGSEFIIFLDSKNQNLNQMAEEISRLTKSLQFDSEIIEIYQNQISSLEIELKAEKSEPRRQQLTNSISEIRTMIERPVVDAKLLSGDVNEKFLELNL